MWFREGEKNTNIYIYSTALNRLYSLFSCCEYRNTIVATCAPRVGCERNHEQLSSVWSVSNLARGLAECRAIADCGAGVCLV